MFHQRKPMANAFGFQRHRGKQVRLLRVSRPACIKQGFPGVEQEWNVKVSFFACLSESHKLFSVEADMVRSIFSTYQVKS